MRDDLDALLQVGIIWMNASCMRVVVRSCFGLHLVRQICSVLSTCPSRILVETWRMFVMSTGAARRYQRAAGVA